MSDRIDSHVLRTMYYAFLGIAPLYLVENI
jgi:hypothetical protein